MKELKEVKLSLKVNAHPEDVWQAWTETTKVSQWFSPEANIEPRLGGAYELFWDPTNHESMSTKGCKIIKYEQGRLLTFTWKGPDQYADIMNHPSKLTRVEVSLQGCRDATEVTIVHDGWGEGEGWAEARAWHEKAWDGVAKSLQAQFE